MWAIEAQLAPVGKSPHGLGLEHARIATRWPSGYRSPSITVERRADVSDSSDHRRIIGGSKFSYQPFGCQPGFRFGGEVIRCHDAKHRLAADPPNPRLGENGRAPMPRFAQVRDNRKLRNVSHWDSPPDDRLAPAKQRCQRLPWDCRFRDRSPVPRINAIGVSVATDHGDACPPDRKRVRFGPAFGHGFRMISQPVKASHASTMTTMMMVSSICVASGHSPARST